ncbi:MAG: YeeE/YedE family protein [Burkholderiales bacterium]
MDNFTPVSALAGGVLIGAASVWLLAANGRIAGVSGILHGLVGPMSASPPGDRWWRAAFIAGLIAAGFAWHAFAGTAPGESTGLVWSAVAGTLVGLGTRIGGGCTSGHGVCGLGRFSLRSLVAVMVFMAGGMAATFVMRHVL